MSETVTCPSCNRPLRVPDELLGRQVKCPACGETFRAERGEAPRAAPAPPPERPPRRRSESVAPRYEDEERPARRGAIARRDDYEDEDEDDRRPSRGRRGRSGRDLAPHRGSTVMTMGILSLFIAPIILGPIAWVMGNNDLREIRAGRMDPEGESQTNTGRVLGMVATILGIVGILIGCVVFAFMLAIGTAASNAPRPGPGPGPRPVAPKRF
jgi:hypothetical protein